MGTKNSSEKRHLAFREVISLHFGVDLDDVSLPNLDDDEDQYGVRFGTSEWDNFYPIEVLEADQAFDSEVSCLDDPNIDYLEVFIKEFTSDSNRLGVYTRLLGTDLFFRMM